MNEWRMSAEDAEEYTRSLGQIMSGGWRQIALAQRLGVPEAIGMTTEAWVRERIGGYVRLGLDERREAVKELTDPNGEFQLSQRQAAEVLGIGKGTVQRDLSDGPSGAAEAQSLEADDDEDGPDGPPDGWTEPDVPFEAPFEPITPPEETAYYRLSRQRLVVRLCPEAVADAAPDPESALVGFEEFQSWLNDFVRVLRERVGAPVRAVK